MEISAHYTSLRPYLFAIAYNMTGQVQEAEDIVQDAFAEMLSKEQEDIRNVKSYITRIVMNKAVDRLRQLKRQRAEYPGPWLPEPYITPTENRIDDILPYAFLHLMEELNPVERAVFILRESFGYSFEEVAEICDVSVENCRQILHRGRQKAKKPVQVSETRDAAGHAKLLDEFMEACLSRDADKLSALLKHDVLLYSDGGGKVAAARKVLERISSVGKFLFGIARKNQDKWSAVRLVSVNNGPALLMPGESGVYLVLIPVFEDGSVAKIFLMRNPAKIFYAKLSQSGPFVDLGANTITPKADEEKI